MGLDKDETDAIDQYLKGEELVQTFFFGGGIAITLDGIDLVEWAPNQKISTLNPAILAQFRSRATETSLGPETEEQPENVFRKEAGQWRVVFGGRSTTLDERRGMLYLQYLLLHPDRYVDCSELVALVAKQGSDVEHPEYSGMSNERLKEEGLSRGTSDDLGKIVDEKTLEAATRRREEIDSLLEIPSDADERLKLEDEREKLDRYLKSGTDKDGHPRQMSSRVDNQRTSVRHAIETAYRHIRDRHPKLQEHLLASIKTGASCIYSPVTPVRWNG